MGNDTYARASDPPPPSPRVYFQALCFSKCKDDFLIPRDASEDGGGTRQPLSLPRTQASWWVADWPPGWRLDGEKRVLMRYGLSFHVCPLLFPSRLFSRLRGCLSLKPVGLWLVMHKETAWTENLNRFGIESGIFSPSFEWQSEGECVDWEMTHFSVINSMKLWSKYKSLKWK